MKNLTIFFSLLMLLSPLVFAETEIYSGKIITDTDKVIDGGTFRFTYDESSEKAFVQTPAGGLIVENGACKPNNIFRVCINSANFSYKNVTTYVYYYELDATIYKLTGSLSTSSKSMLSTLLQGESTELTITITNPTDFEITSISLDYDLAPFFVKESKGCELNNKQVLWKGSLQSKYDKTCTATILAEKEGKYTLSGNLSYFNGFDTEKKATDNLEITVLPKQLKISQFIDNNTEAGKPFYFNISLQNIHSSEDIDALSIITLPSHASLIKDKPEFEKSARVLKDSLTLKPGASLNYSLYMEKLSEGTEPVNLRFEYTIKGINDVIENSTFIDIIAVQPANKSEKPKIEEKKYNETVTNLTATQNISSQTISENKTEVKPEGNKTTEVVVMDLQEPKPSNKMILFLIISALAVFTAIMFVVLRIRKRKKASEDLKGKIIKDVEDELNKPKTF